MTEWVGRWTGRTVVCIASGPSLTVDDCETVRDSRLPTIVTNTSFLLTPWAEVLMAFDSNWWKHYSQEVAAGRWPEFRGEKLTCSRAAAQYGAKVLLKEGWFQHFHNSGATAASLAISGGASKVVLLGFDCQRTGGQTHWFGDHPPALSNARTIANWPTQFKNLARYAKSRGVPVVNATRETALKMFPRVALERALAGAMEAQEVAA